MPHRDDRRLVRRLVAGEEMAFEQFANTYIPVLFRVARRRLGRGDRELAGDLVQSTLCKAIAKLDSYRGDAALVTWLCTCLRNEIAGFYRKRSRSGREINLAQDDDVAAELSFKPVLSRDPEQALLHEEGIELVHEALDLLPPHYGRALEWKYLEDLSVKEIASRLDLSPKAAESLLTRARVSFRDEYSRLFTGRRASPDPT